MAATVAAFLSQSYLTSQKTSQDVSAFYLAQIYQLQLEAALNTGNHSVPSQQTPPVVTPVPRITHILWFSSLASSLSSAVLAILVQGWVRRYLVLAEPQHSTHSRARIRAYVSREGSQRLLQLTVEVMTLSLDVSIYSFLSGLVILAHNNGDDLCGLITQLTLIPLTLLYLWFTGFDHSPSYYVFYPTVHGGSLLETGCLGSSITSGDHLGFSPGSQLQPLRQFCLVDVGL